MLLVNMMECLDQVLLQKCPCPIHSRFSLMKLSYVPLMKLISVRRLWIQPILDWEKKPRSN
jgi:hypothetical protein